MAEESESDRQRRLDEEHLKTVTPKHPLFGVQPGIYREPIPQSQYMRLLTRWTKIQPVHPTPIKDLDLNGTPDRAGNILTSVFFKDRISGPTAAALAEVEREFFRRYREVYEANPTQRHRWILDAKDRWENEEMAIDRRWLEPFQRINQAMSDVPKTCRRGWPTAIVVSPYMHWLLRHAQTDFFAPRRDMIPIHPLPETMPGSILEPLGMYTAKFGPDRPIHLYLNADFPDDHPAIVGYRGASQVDAGVFLIQYPDGFGLEYPENETDTHYAPEWWEYFSAVQVIPYKPGVSEYLRGL